MKAINLNSCPTNGLVMVNHDQVVTTSLKVAEYFRKPHKDVLKSRKMESCLLLVNSAISSDDILPSLEDKIKFSMINLSLVIIIQ